MKEYLDMWNWESECWGESNVANFNKMEEQLIEQCLQTPVNGAFQQKAMQSAPVQSFSFQNFNQQPVQNVQNRIVQYPAATNSYPMIQYPFMSMYAHGRKRRSSDAEWISASELKELWVYKVSNLTCFMKGMGVIDDNYNIQKNFLRTKVWEMKDLRATEHLSDPVWRNKVSQHWVDCADMAESIPEKVLDNCPMSRMFGPMARCMKFIQCKKVCICCHQNNYQCNIFCRKSLRSAVAWLRLRSSREDIIPTVLVAVELASWGPGTGMRRPWPAL